ncbi:uncharacterized protein LOC100572268 [Acyrthosiphon pisum]|uniref:Uncharacterized protein n=1 Tax=Acyrthosiphon pisum TaxID=7029 RepID=A0A8R1W8U8_ACYPI|nr:uncharacterized protein LOC100572268 [Acyrthosiphon pisum]|eukprot:XP_003242477.1 PREDICTED: uncharacterized protein LOC100572268 isoform X1 [Acyrthosiphon pisum]
MGFSMNVEQLVHEAIDVKNGQINQYFLAKLLEIIVRQSNIHSLNVDFTENDKKYSQSCELVKPFELQSIHKRPSEEIILNSEVELKVSGIELATTDIQDNSTLSCDSVDSFEESLERIYKEPSKAIILDPELSEENADKISTPSTFCLNRFLEEKHEYFLHNGDQHVIAELIEKLFGKIKKIDKATKLLKKSIKTFKAEDGSDGSPDSDIDALKKIAFSDMGSAFEIEKHGYDRLRLDENLKNLEMSAKGETFRDIFGATQKRKDLHSNLSILNFREFDLDYRTNFMTIQTFIELHKELLNKAKTDIEELKKNCLNNDYLIFKKDVLLRLIKIEDGIKKYIARDPEAMGITRFIKDGSCMSCATPAMMKMTNTAPVGKDMRTSCGSRFNRETLKEKRRKTKTNKPIGQINVLPINIKAEQTKSSPDVGNCNYKINKLQIYYNRNPHYKNSSYNRVLKDIQKMHENGSCVFCRIPATKTTNSDPFPVGKAEPTRYWR